MMEDSVLMSACLAMALGLCEGEELVTLAPPAWVSRDTGWRSAT